MSTFQIKKTLSFRSLSFLAVVLLALFFVPSFFAPVEDSSAEDVAAVINSNGYYLSLTSENNGLVQIDVVASASGRVGLGKDTINIKSNAPAGYDLYLSVDNDDENGDRLYKDGDSTSSSFIVPTSGTLSNPTALDTNSWGFALANTTAGLPTSNGFDAAYDPANPDENSKWAAVPLLGQAELIQTVNTSDTVDGIDTDIYYGVKANATLPSGVYKGTITYMVVSRDGPASVTETASVTPSSTTKLEGGDTITINAPLNVTAAQAQDSENPITVTIGGESCPLTTGIVGDVSNPTTTDGVGNAEDGSLIITCVSPSMPTGNYDVAIDVPKYHKFWLTVNGIKYKYSTTEQDAAISQVTGGNAAASEILAGKTAYIGGNLVTGTMPAFTQQYDSTKTDAENTANAGLTWSSDGSVLTISEGYHTQQQVNSQSGESELLFAAYGRTSKTTYQNIGTATTQSGGTSLDDGYFSYVEADETFVAKKSFTATLTVFAFQQWGYDNKISKAISRVLQNGTQIVSVSSSNTSNAVGDSTTIEISVKKGDVLQFQRRKNGSDGGSAGGLFFIHK